MIKVTIWQLMRVPKRPQTLTKYVPGSVLLRELAVTAKKSGLFATYGSASTSLGKASPKPRQPLNGSDRTMGPFAIRYAVGTSVPLAKKIGRASCRERV